MNVDLIKLDKLVEGKYLSKRKHPTEDLWIFNYTEKCQYEPYWTEETLMCRGLIVDASEEIKARPFKKFFNLDESTSIPNGEFKVYEKMDGSLGVLYWIGEVPYVSTRGSFESDQSVKATQILHSNPGKWKWFKPGVTYLFEIIYPQNKIVVNYGMTEDIVFLAAIDNETGEDVVVEDCPFTRVKEYDGIKDASKLKDFQEDNKEGFVLKWSDGLRLKFKFEEYVRLHRLVTGTTARSIWDLMKNKQPFAELLSNVPDEFYGWVKFKKDYFEKQYHALLNEAKAFIFARDLDKIPRRDAAKLILERKKNISALVFQVLDKRDPDELLWKMLYPPHELPFKIET